MLGHALVIGEPKVLSNLRWAGILRQNYHKGGKVKNLTINDLKLGTNHLLAPAEPRFEALKATKAWTLYGAHLTQKNQELNALSTEITGVTRLTTEALTETDAAHDGFGGAFFVMMDAYLRAPDTSKKIRGIALELRTTFINSLAELKGTYSDEASRAKARLLKLGEYKDKLSLFPLAEGKTVYDWVKAFLENGSKLDDLMAERALMNAEQVDPARSASGALRGEMIGLLSLMRSTIQYELTQNKALRPNLDALLFGYFDELQTKRQAGSTAPAEPPTAPEQTE
jgi:hypothetical protein